MNTEQQACLGGFCPRRTSCVRYVCPQSRQEPAERLCKQGEDHYRQLGAPVQIAEPAPVVPASAPAPVRQATPGGFLAEWNQLRGVAA
jgi:hypothetical protein